MVKVLVFLLILTGIIIYPVIISSNLPKIQRVEIKNLPNIEIVNGKFFIFKNLLEKKGSFDKLDLLNQKSYLLFNLNVYDLLKKEYYFTKKAIFKENIVKGFNVYYKNSNFELNTTKAIYNRKNRMLIGGRFKIISNDYKGYGLKFKLDKNKNISAENITYYLKVKK